MVVDGSGNRLSNPIISNRPVMPNTNRVNNQSIPNSTAASFESILRKKLSDAGEIKFSKHAEQRLQSRNITLTQAQKDKMREAVAKAESKGVKDSLVLMDNLAFVVNVPNKTVITAANSSELKESVFTNIDGAVII